MMRGPVFSALLLAACGAPAPNEYPDSARESFAKSCPAGEPKCDCAWDKITRSMTHAEYEAAMERFAREGLMDPRLTAARSECLDAH
jgi:hypothetical protein